MCACGGVEWGLEGGDMEYFEGMIGQRQRRFFFLFLFSFFFFFFFFFLFAIE